MGVSMYVDLGIKRGGTIGHEQVGDHWENFDNIPVLVQHFIEILIRLDQMELDGLFEKKHRSFVVSLGLT